MQPLLCFYHYFYHYYQLLWLWSAHSWQLPDGVRTDGVVTEVPQFPPTFASSIGFGHGSNVFARVGHVSKVFAIFYHWFLLNHGFKSLQRNRSRDPSCKRVLEYGVRGTGYGLRFSTDIYGSKREKTAFHKNLQEAFKNLQEACLDLPEVSRNIRKPPGIHGIMWSRNPVLQFPVIFCFSICACHACAGAMLIFSASFQF